MDIEERQFSGLMDIDPIERKIRPEHQKKLEVWA